jgi:hypothetical protein
MATTTAPPTSPSRPKRSANRSRPAPAVLPPGGRQRRWSLALLAVLLTLGSGLLFALLYLNAGDRVPVLALASDVAQGQEIEQGDLTEVRVSTDESVEVIPASEIDEVVGQQAAVDLVSGSLLTRSQLGAPVGIEAGTAIVGVPVGAGGVPFADVRQGMTVEILFTPEPSNKEQMPEGAEVLATGTVFNVEPTVDDGVLLVALLVDEEVAPRVATAAHNRQLALAVVGTGTVLSTPAEGDTTEGEGGAGEATTTTAGTP